MTEARHDDPVQRRLAEMDERLRLIQAELELDGGLPASRPPPGERLRRQPRAPRIFPPAPATPSQPREPPPPSAAAPPGSAAEPPATPAAPPVTPAGPRAAAEEMAARLLAALRELLAGYEIALAHMTG